MTNHNTPEQIEKRKNQDDPIVMYLIVRKDLDMGIGKACAQCAHASQMLLLKYFDVKEYLIENFGFLPENVINTLSTNIKQFSNWLDWSFRKVVLKADEKEWEKLKLEYFSNIPLEQQLAVIVIDAGLTEVEPGTETVIGLFPMQKSIAPKLIKRLRVL